ncbi:detoxifying efflux carrier 35 [Prunus dulcis]|uniref:Detoxifying efflux carrier 35 n=1 Tax=Prunus dulcis TaxID=3755 RepID=A0A5H2XPC3_PRUDU|nr:detoxifying efflux carrier 35 [Prunus dulcis]
MRESIGLVRYPIVARLRNITNQNSEKLTDRAFIRPARFWQTDSTFNCVQKLKESSCEPRDTSNRGIGVDPTNLSVPLSIVDPRGQRKGTTEGKKDQQSYLHFTLGSGRPRAAKYSVYVTVFQCLLMGIFFMIVILITKDSFSILFTSDKDLQQAVAKLAYLFACLVLEGVAIGCGWQALVAYINLGCYYIFGLPLGYLLGYIANLGVMVRLCGGMICGTALQTLLLMIVLYKTNWNKEVEQATKRVRKWGTSQLRMELKVPEILFSFNYEYKKGNDIVRFLALPFSEANAYSSVHKLNGVGACFWTLANHYHDLSMI